MRWAKPANQGFEDAATDEVTTSNSYPEAYQDEQNDFPVTETIDYQTKQQDIQRYPCTRAAYAPHQRIQPLAVMPVNP